MALETTPQRLRRKWSDEEKLHIVIESYDESTTVSAVAKKHKVSAVSLYHWRKHFGTNPLALLDKYKGQNLKGQDSMAPDSHGSTEGGMTWGLPQSPARPSPQALAGRVRDVLDASARSYGADDRDLNARIEALSLEIARLKSEILASRRHRRVLTEVLFHIGEQLRLVRDLEGEDFTGSQDRLERRKGPL